MATYTLPEGFTEFDMFTFGSALLVGGMLGFFLNAISILSFLRVREMRNPSNFLVFNLAVADLSLNINGLTAAYASYLRYWPFGQDGCAYHGFQGMISILASISFLAAIAWDRYHQYCTRQKLFWTTSVTISSIIWILSIFWSAVPLMGWGVYDFEPMRTCCTLDYTKGDRDYITYMLSLVVLYLMLPAFNMFSCYDAIYKHFKKIHHHRAYYFSILLFACHSLVVVSYTEYRSVTSSGVMVAILGPLQFNTSLPLRVLLMCWGPYVIMCVYACFDNVKLVSPKLRMMLPVIAKTNPTFNALLYSFGNEFYRGGVWHFLTGQKIVEPDIKKSK